MGEFDRVIIVIIYVSISLCLFSIFFCVFSRFYACFDVLYLDERERKELKPGENVKNHGNQPIVKALGWRHGAT